MGRPLILLYIIFYCFFFFLGKYCTQQVPPTHFPSFGGTIKINYEAGQEYQNGLDFYHKGNDNYNKLNILKIVE